MKLALPSFAVLGLVGFALGDLLHDILTALENATDCAGCDALLVPIQALAHLGNDAFVDTFTNICELIQAADDDVCAGEMARTGPVIAHSLRQISIGGTTSQKFCNAAFGLCQEPAITRFDVQFPSAAPKNPKTFTSTGKPPFQVVHLSDVHIDPQYVVGSDASCGKPICCRVFNDSAATPAEPAGPFGASTCDPPESLANSMFSAVTRFGRNAKFTIFTGDVEEHDTWLVEKRNVKADLESFNAQLKNKLTMPVYPAIGNHDAVPSNAFPRNITDTSISEQWVFDTQSAGWKAWLGGSAAAEIETNSGSYAITAEGTNMRIISVNTQFWYKQNFWLYDTDTQVADPNGLFAFMVRQLQAAEDVGQRAWIIGHIPSGKSDISHDQSNYYDQIVQRYKDTIAVQFFGHSHKDQFEIAYSDYSDQTASTADSILYIAPALTPTSGNPAFKIYDIDPDTYEVMDMKVYMTNISSPTFQTSPTWELYYSARDAYGPLVTPPLPSSAPLDAAFWHNVTTVFSTNTTTFGEYNERISRGGQVTACTGDCQKTTICDMRAARSENNCDPVTPGLSFSKRSTEGLQVEAECGGTPLLGKILWRAKNRS